VALLQLQHPALSTTAAPGADYPRFFAQPDATFRRTPRMRLAAEIRSPPSRSVRRVASRTISAQTSASNQSVVFFFRRIAHTRRGKLLL
jgi:hypothetical protein